MKVNPEDKCTSFHGSCKFCQQLKLPCPALEINHTPDLVSRGFPEPSGCLFLTLYRLTAVLSPLPRYTKVTHSPNFPSAVSKCSWRTTCSLFSLLLIDVSIGEVARGSRAACLLWFCRAQRCPCQPPVAGDCHLKVLVGRMLSV